MAVSTSCVVGAGSSAFQTMNNVVALRHAHRNFYGRVIGLMFVAWGLTNLAGLPAGLMADWWGERTILMAMGAVLCFFTVLFVLWSRLIEAGEKQSRSRRVEAA